MRVEQATSPLVTCLMVTKPGPQRLPMVARSIACYLRQTFTSAELLIALDAGPEADRRAIEAHVADLGRPDLRVIRAPGQPTLGRLRNFAIEHARGALIAIWDDDDIHHPERLEQQVNALRASGAVATFLSEVLHLFIARQELHWTNYRSTIQKCHPATGLFQRAALARYPETGSESLRGEDTVFCGRLFQEGPVQIVDGAAPLYIYVSHGDNVSGDHHHLMLARSLGVSRGRLLRHEGAVREALARAEIGGDPVNVVGNNGLAFSWQRAR